jgi:hypothetical protein
VRGREEEAPDPGGAAVLLHQVEDAHLPAHLKRPGLVEGGLDPVGVEGLEAALLGDDPAGAQDRTAPFFLQHEEVTLPPGLFRLPPEAVPGLFDPLA